LKQQETNPYYNNLGQTNEGQKRYELSNHLGNVLAVINDRKTKKEKLNTPYYEPTVISAQDYFPFGQEMGSDRSFNASSSYRYGFNGKEKDEDGEWGSTTHYDYGFRIYNPSIGRFLSVDPMTRGYPMLTPYQYASNSPIKLIDIDGLEGGSPPSENSKGYDIKLGVIRAGHALNKTVYNALDAMGRLFGSEEPNTSMGIDAISSAEKNTKKVESKSDVNLSGKVPFVSQFTLTRPNVACCRASQKILKDFGLDNSGLKSNRIIVARNNTEDTSLEILKTAKQGADYIDAQLEEGNPVMVGVNHTLSKGQSDGEAADHFVVITGRETDEEGGVSYTFYEVGTKHTSKGKSKENSLKRNADDSLSGTNFRNKNFTVTDIRKNESKKP